MSGYVWESVIPRDHLQIGPPRRKSLTGALALLSVMMRRAHPAWSLAEYRYVTKSILGCYPVLYFPLWRIYRRTVHYLARLVDRKTHIAVCGFPRSANTFVTVALRRTIGPGAKIASHHHVPSQAISAIRLGVPILVLIRNPIDAVASWHIFTPHIRTELQLWDYALYYETLLRYRRRFLIVPFETATKDMNKVVAAINARFGMQVPKPDLDSQSIQLIFRELEGQHGHGDEILTAVERTLPRPSKVRSLLTPAIVAEIRSPQNAEALARAMAVYREFLSSIRNEEPGFAVG